MERRDKRKTLKYKASKSKKYEKRKKIRGNDKRKLQQLSGRNFYSSPYPQTTADEIEVLESSLQLMDRKSRRRRERKALREQIAILEKRDTVKQYKERERDENSRREWLHVSHKNKFLMRRNLEMAEMKRRDEFEKKHVAVLKERLMEMEKEDALAARSLAGLFLLANRAPENGKKPAHLVLSSFF